ncbi:MAG: caspase family protein [Spirochaetaceae bacterium]
MIKKILLILLLISSATLFSSETRLVKRYAILVGANNGGDERAILRYAESDAKMIANVFADIGGIENSDSILLLNPTKSSIKRSFDKMTNNILTDGVNTRTELIFYYSGHSTEEGLLVRDALLTYKELKESLESTNADVKIGILDSCSSGAFTLLKGGKHNASFLVDESVKTTGHAFITSSSENEAAQESNRLQASFFTHFLVSALRGAADTSSDGKVTLHEAFSYASNETLARTEATQAGAQHASYDFRLTGSGDIVLTDLRNAESKIEFQEDDYGRFFIRDNEDNLISEVNKKHGVTLQISVPSSLYTIIKEVDGIYSKQKLLLNPNDSKVVSLYKYEEFTPEKNVVRGGNTNEIEYDLDVPEITAIFGWSTFDEVREASLDLNLFSKAGSLEGTQISLANMVINDARGAQISALFNLDGGDFTGVQVSGLANTVGGNIENYGIQVTGLYNWVSHGSDSFGLQISGLFNWIGSDTEAPTIQISGLFNNIGGNSHSITMQTSGLYNTSKNISGFQIAGLFNSSNDVNGAQISGVNISETLKGIQISYIFNSAFNVYGAQVSLVNIADYVYGTQIGLVNINKDIKGLSIGLINISTDGIQNFNYKYNTSSEDHIIDYQFGSSMLYHLIYVGLPNDLDNIDRLSVGTGLGLHIPIGNLYIEMDASLNNKLLYDSSDLFTYTGSYPNISGKIALPLWGDVAIFVGINFDFPIIIDEDVNFKTDEFKFDEYEHSFFFGLRI